jgi:hypothetical protein
VLQYTSSHVSISDLNFGLRRKTDSTVMGPVTYRFPALRNVGAPVTIVQAMNPLQLRKQNNLTMFHVCKCSARRQEYYSVLPSCFSTRRLSRSKGYGPGTYLLIAWWTLQAFVSLPADTRVDP